MRKRSFFQSDQQYNRYKRAIGHARKMQKLIKSDHMIIDMDNNSIINGDVVITRKSKWSGINLKVNKNFTLTLLSFAYGEDGKPWIEDTLKDIDKSFSCYKFIKKENLQTIL